jgi:hypothetical protein
MRSPTVRRHPNRPRLKYWNAFTRWVLHVSLLRWMADHQVCELNFSAARSGRPLVLPVMYAQRADTLVVLVGGAQHKQWWRNFIHPHPVQVWLRGASRTGVGHVVDYRSPERADAARLYRAKFPDVPVETDPLVVITLNPAA